MKLVVIIPYLETMSPGQIQMAQSIKKLANPDVKGAFCGPGISSNEFFDADYFMNMADPKQGMDSVVIKGLFEYCLLYTSPSPRDAHESRMPSSA